MGRVLSVLTHFIPSLSHFTVVHPYSPWLASGNGILIHHPEVSHTDSRSGDLPAMSRAHFAGLRPPRLSPIRSQDSMHHQIRCLGRSLKHLDNDDWSLVVLVVFVPKFRLRQIPTSVDLYQAISDILGCKVTLRLVCFEDLTLKDTLETREEKYQTNLFINLMQVWNTPISP